MMPRVDGYETLRRLRALPLARTTPVVFITAGSPDRPSLERAYALGAVDYIAKPVEPAVLLGKVRAFLSMFEQAQEIRRQADALRSKDRFLGVLAHDLRTPLSVVGMTAMQFAEHEDPLVKAASKRLGRAALRMQSLSDDLLETARMALGSLRFRPEPVDVCEVLEDLLADFTVMHPGVRFERRLPQQVVVDGDRMRLQQAISNLLTNAVKYGTGWTLVQVASDAHDVRIEFANECRELNANDIESLFAPFAQGTSRAGGVGLGLYIVREIGRLHDGGAYGKWSDGVVSFGLKLPRAAN